MKKDILQKISEASLEEILDIRDFSNIDWIWINQEIFRDLLSNLQLEESFKEEELDQFSKNITIEEMVNLLQKGFKNKNYLPMNQYYFSMVEDGFKPTKDIETVIFIKDQIHRRYLVKLTNSYAWMLKAMAIDTYLKMSSGYKTLREIYEELYEENSRIIEDVLSNGQHTFLTGYWKLERKTNELYFYKAGEFYHSWAEGEVHSKFEELSKR